MSTTPVSLAPVGSDRRPTGTVARHASRPTRGSGGVGPHGQQRPPSLDDIDGIVNAGSNDEWKGIARRRLRSLEEQIAQLEHARGYLEGALLCRFDHPLTDCLIMGAEIDRRLAAPASGTAEEREAAGRE